jgi:hypothetical protein
MGSVGSWCNGASAGTPPAGTSGDGAWWNTINIRHRNGSDDGASTWGGQFAFGMTAYTHVLGFRTRNNSTWNGWYHVWHDGNLNQSLNTSNSPTFYSLTLNNGLQVSGSANFSSGLTYSSLTAAIVTANANMGNVLVGGQLSITNGWIVAATNATQWIQATAPGTTLPAPVLGRVLVVDGYASGPVNMLLLVPSGASWGIRYRAANGLLTSAVAGATVDITNRTGIMIGGNDGYWHLIHA